MLLSIAQKVCYPWRFWLTLPRRLSFHQGLFHLFICVHDKQNFLNDFEEICRRDRKWYKVTWATIEQTLCMYLFCLKYGCECLTTTLTKLYVCRI